MTTILRVAADENFPSTVIADLRERGHDVLSAREIQPAGSDAQLLRRAQAEKRIVVTFDLDFGELAYQWGLDSHCGVILFRLHKLSRESMLAHVIETLETPMNWTGHFASVKVSHTRLHPLPPLPSASDR